ncbi:MAG TPA: helix-turn-helix transcriptional regulator [Gammaproteobacteria bacterium]|nr:helix-turn-helix transcriptional regulator [Gammaproteobacteria bacterium]
MKTKDHLALFGRNVKTIRKEKGLSQEELASKAGVHRTYVGMIERGEKNITLTNILKLSGALKVSPSSLLENVK